MRIAAKQHYLAALLLTIVIPVALAYLYRAIPWQTWLAAATANSALSLVLLTYYRHNLSAWFLTQHDFRFYIPALAVLLFCLLAIFGASFYGSSARGAVATHHYLWLSWIPVVEEIVFRLGIGGCLRRLAGNFWGSYCSVLCFALAHTLPSWERVSAGVIGLPVGPLLLGAVCEFLFVRSRSLMPSIVFHAVCNASVPLFLYFDRRWLTWLSLLFQTSDASP